MVVIDTSVLIHYLHGDRRVVDAVDRHVGSGKGAITCIGRYELLKGTSKQNIEKVESFIATMDTYWIDEKSLSIANEMYHNLKEKGTPVDDADILIMSIALANGEKIITTDKDFTRMGGKEVILL